MAQMAQINSYMQRIYWSLYHDYWSSRRMQTSRLRYSIVKQRNKNT